MAGAANSYLYRPPKHLAISDTLYALVVYVTREHYHFKRVVIHKYKDGYFFSFKTPDSAQVLIMAVADIKNNILDNNNELGFISYFFDKNGKLPASAIIEATYLLSYYALRPLKLNYDKLKPVMIELFEKAYKLCPALKNEKPYTYYLKILHEEKKDEVKPLLLNYANKMAEKSHSEEDWLRAIKIYDLLGMDLESQAVQQKAVQTYPDGEVAKDKFLNNFDASDTTETTIMTAMKEYVRRFKDTSDQMKYTFYDHLIRRLLFLGEWNKALSYESEMPDKISVAHIYNDFASQLSGGSNLEDTGSNITIAKLLSRRALEQFRTLNGSVNVDDDDGNLQRVYNKIASQYALILYKIGQYDSAFYYQEVIYKQTNSSDPVDIERYVLYGAKSKGISFAYGLVEGLLANGKSSFVITEQLKTFAKELNLSDSALNALYLESFAVSNRSSSAKIKKVLGSDNAKYFTLRNLNNKNISLLSLRDKVIVLDFWATWCVPCRASLLEMRTLADKYKSDTSVVFLFIDTWENISSQKMREQATRFIKENNYNFEVLLDEKNMVADAYRVDFIPARFIISRGKIVFMGSTTNLLLEIEYAKNPQTNSIVQ